MKIKLKEVSIRELAAGYKDNGEEGVFGYGGKLDIRPPYQREFVYKDAQREAVVHSVVNDYPLNVMYWAVQGDGTLEVIDGQQRTISICQYVGGVFMSGGKYFHNLGIDQQNRILDYSLMVYFCNGSDREKLEWFRTINISGEKLTNQELRNTVYSGSWVSDAKRHFSKSGCAAHDIGCDYLTGASIRQDYLETAIKWLSDGEIESYMAQHQGDSNANELWLYFQNVINWVKLIFPKYRREMKGVAWGDLFNRFADAEFDSKLLERDVSRLMLDDDVTSKKGVYSYVLTGDERHLNIRSFTLQQKRQSYEIQSGMCVICGDHFEIEEMEPDHITPWHDGGRTSAVNCQMLCRKDNRQKSGK